MTAVFLDLDGTLTDPKPGITSAIIHALTALGHEAPNPDDLEWAIGPPLLESFQRLGVANPDEALSLYRGQYTQQGLFDARVYDGIPDAVRDLSDDGHRLFLMTAKPHVYAVKITAHFELDIHMEAQFGPELDGTHQDKGELLCHALNLTGINVAEAVMIGDRDNDLRAAITNDVRFIGAL